MITGVDDVDVYAGAEARGGEGVVARRRLHLARIQGIFLNPTNRAPISVEYSSTQPTVPPSPQNIPPPNQSCSRIRRIFLNPTNRAPVSAEYSSTQPIVPP
eukprot:5212995-Pyramimonas_sp.AAC.1